MPKEQRLGQVGMSNNYGEMKIIRYKNNIDIDIFFEDYDCMVKNKSYDKFLKGHVRPNLKQCREGKIKLSNQNKEMMVLNYRERTDIDIIFLHSWCVVRNANYDNFIRGRVKNPLYYKEKYENQMRKANNGQWMLLLIWNDTNNCVVEFEDGTLVDCNYVKFNKGNVANPNYIKPSENKFYFNNDLNCWVGVTNKGEEFLFNHPDEKVIEYVKKYTWYVGNGYIINGVTNKRLHHIIKTIPDDLKDKYDRIDHVDNNPLNNCYDNLRWSNAKENSKNRKAIHREKFVGLQYVKNWFGKYKNFTTKHKENKQDALIDLLIMQKYFKVTHNEHLWYLLDDISQERIDEVIENIKRQIEKQKNRVPKVTCRNTFKKIDNDTYKMYDSKNRICLIDVDDIEKIKMGTWNCKIDKNKNYFRGITNFNKNTKTFLLHRYIINLLDKRYAKFFIDHLDGDGLNNKKENLVITDIKGNNINIFGKGFRVDEYNDRYIGTINLNKQKKSKSFKTKQEAINFYNYYKQVLINGRLQWKTKEELDKWLEDIKNNELTIDKAIEQHYEKLYRDVGELIEKEYTSKVNKKLYIT